MIFDSKHEEFDQIMELEKSAMYFTYVANN